MIQKPKRFRRKTVPDDAPPLIRDIIERANKMRLSYSDIYDRCGVDEKTILRWKNGVEPRVGCLEAVLEVVGLRLVAVPIERTEP